MKKRFNRIYIEITNKCNLNCSFCQKTTRNIKEMKIQEFEEVIRKIKDYTNTICLHVKGEPLLASNINEILSVCDKNNLQINLTTNGTLLKSKINDLKNHKSLSKIHISLNAEVNNIDYLDNILNSISLFPQEKIIIYSLWAQKSNKLDEKSTIIVEKLKDYYHLSTKDVEKIKTQKNIKLAKNVYLDKNTLFTWPKINEEKNNGSCKGLKDQIAILSNGIVTPCCLDGEGIINLGNIFTEDLKSILTKEKSKKIIKGFQENKCVEKLCQSCSYKNRFKKN